MRRWRRGRSMPAWTSCHMVSMPLHATGKKDGTQPSKESTPYNLSLLDGVQLFRLQHRCVQPSSGSSKKPVPSDPISAPGARLIKTSHRDGRMFHLGQSLGSVVCVPASRDERPVHARIPMQCGRFFYVRLLGLVSLLTCVCLSHRSSCMTADR